MFFLTVEKHAASIGSAIGAVGEFYLDKLVVDFC